MSRTSGQYRLRDSVSIQNGLVSRSGPLVVTRLNDSAQDLLKTVSTDEFQSVTAIAREGGVSAESTGALLSDLYNRGFLEWRPARDPEFQPPVSIILTVRNEADAIEPALDALADLNYPEYEVVVVDDGSTDDTRELIRSHSLTADGNLRLVPVGSDTEPLGIGASRNRGVSSAANEIIAFTDADCRPNRAWLSNLVPALATHDVVGGRVRPTDTARPMHEYEGIHSSLDMGPRASPVDREQSTPYLPTANLVGHREVFEKTPFPERNVAEDVGVSWDALANGFDLVYDPTGVVEHDYGGVTNFLGRRLSYGGSEALLAKLYGHPGSVSLPAISLVGLVLLAVLPVVNSMLNIGASLGTFLAAMTVLGFVITPTKQAFTSVITGSIRVSAAVAGLFRGSLSRVYGFALEVTRYYSLPLVALGILAGVGGLEFLAISLLAIPGICVVVALAIDLSVNRPSSPVRYSLLYLVDHLTYQIGAYRGAVENRTVAHLRPSSRFSLTL
ncbi:FkbM family methyltransferase [Halodesulfurarchaeum formicicum]|uniref:FkbM family methyltransferase n=1 Tax=Halodesulfurarchaeum formicicum TaxID=1873524 RepID=A0A1D8S252_9EURY|nr:MULTISPECIES: glycosyltransferase family 2 protein [Halodesulfurarchaeum]AOW79435.1 FkbM family methyltransferase [Halodesulfurarchaeum formicicum]APE94688.1 FkbM family methyltransferase [Halodesulfurarchaeum formicicum]MDR5655944.1 glycosyltransferase family 2 protein [Halodesulfurarchaeum sp. HSR-GB]